MNRQELFENIEQVKIGLDEPFHFKCRSCGKCCKNREDILLTPRDIFRIALYLQKTSTEVIEEYCEYYIGKAHPAHNTARSYWDYVREIVHL